MIIDVALWQISPIEFEINAFLDNRIDCAADFVRRKYIALSKSREALSHSDNFLTSLQALLKHQFFRWNKIPNSVSRYPPNVPTEQAGIF